MTLTDPFLYEYAHTKDNQLRPTWGVCLVSRAFADMGAKMARDEQRIQHLIERVACLDDDVEKMQKMIGRMNGSPTLWPYQDTTLRRV
jgi:hypothetical protein